jgi:hypothetical protein
MRSYPDNVTDQRACIVCSDKLVDIYLATIGDVSYRQRATLILQAVKRAILILIRDS